jgi:hypothetical protein
MLSFRNFPKAARASNHVATRLARRVNNGTVDGLREPRHALTPAGKKKILPPSRSRGKDSSHFSAFLP